MDKSFVLKHIKSLSSPNFQIWVAIICFLSPFYSFGQFQKSWDKLYGGQSYEELHEIYELSDGFIMMGSASFSFAADFPFTNGQSDYWLYKTDVNGEIIWSKVYGSDSTEIFQTGMVFQNGDYALGGFSHGNMTGDHSQNGNGGRDFWVMRADSDGNLLWDFTFGGDGEDYLVSMSETNDGGLILGGWTNSPISGDVTEAPRGYFDYLIVKIDGNGNLLWQKRFGGDKDDRGISVIEASDGNIYFLGVTNSGQTGDKTMPSFGLNDHWLIKLDGNGNFIWNKAYGGSLAELPFEIMESADGNIILAGSSESKSGGNKTASNFGSTDFWNIKIDFDGNMIWDKSYGGSSTDVLHTVNEGAKGNLILSGTSFSPISGLKTERNRGHADYWMIICDKDGNFIYDKTYGGSKKEELKTVIQTSDNGFIFGGYTESSNEDDITDVSKGFQDNWVIKMQCDISLDLLKDTSICYGQSLNVIAKSNSSDICSYMWSTGDRSPSIDIVIQSDTIISVLIVDVFGCMIADTFNVEMVPLPKVDLGPDQIICPDETITLSDLSIFDHLWTGGSTDPTFEVTDSGTYRLILTNSTGCSNFDDVVISYFEEKTTKFDVHICEGESFFVGGGLQTVNGIYYDTLNTIYFCDSILATNLVVHLPDTTNLEDYVCSESQLGTLKKVRTNQYGCDSVILTKLLLAPTDSIYFYEFTCDINNEQVWYDIETNQYGCDSFLIHDVQFVPPDTSLVDATTCDVLQAGISVTTLNNFRGCDSFIITTTQYIHPDTLYIDQPTCFIDGVGVFYDTLSNFYGCDSFVIRNVILEELQYQINVHEISCPGEKNGGFIFNVSFGTPPYQYALNDEVYGSGNSFYNLGPGIYELKILDGNSCEWFETYELEEPEFVDFNQEIPIFLPYGDSIQIDPSFTHTVDTFYWTENEGISCLDCLNPVLSPEIQSIYQLDFIIDGCKVTKLIPVHVIHDRSVFLPTGFTPNGDGINDFFTIYGSHEIDIIQQFKIYDRWGNNVFSIESMRMSEDEIKWDGTFRGKELNAGVFTYFVLIQFTDGRKESYEGNVTLLH